MNLPHCGKYHKVLFTLWKLSAFLPQNYLNFLTLTIHIVNHLEHFIHVSSIEPTDLRGTSTNPSTICKISSASMLAALVQYSISGGRGKLQSPQEQAGYVKSLLRFYLLPVNLADPRLGVRVHIVSRDQVNPILQGGQILWLTSCLYDPLSIVQLYK